LTIFFGILLLFFILIVFMILCIGLSTCFIPLFIYYHVWLFIYYIYHSDYIACTCYFTLSVYTWDILLAYIRRQLSSRLHFNIFWEAGRDSFHQKIHGGPPPMDEPTIHLDSQSIKRTLIKNCAFLKLQSYTLSLLFYYYNSLFL